LTKTPPEVSKLEPNRGSQVGFKEVTIRGNHLLPDGAKACVQCTGVVVHFGTANVAVALGAPDGLLVFTPPHAPGKVNVTVTTNPGGTSTEKPADEYEYEDPPKHKG
jgi:hypothetical protein